MTKGKVFLLAALTAWPFMVPVIGLLIERAGLIPSTTAQPPAAFVFFLAFLFLTPAAVIALLVFYLAYLFSRPEIPKERKIVWAAALLIGHVFTMPVFWVQFIWRRRYPGPLLPSSRFSLLVFSPLLVALLLPLAYVFPMTLTVETASTPGSDPVETLSHWIWVAGPILGAMFIYVVGKGCYAWLGREGLPRPAWFFLWGFFSVMSFGAIWDAIIVLRSLLPSDAPPNTLSDLTRIAVVLTLVAQPGVLGWLFATSRLMRRFDLGKYPPSS